MNRQNFLLLALAGGLSVGLVGNAQAGAYSVSYNNILNLAITSTDENGRNGPLFIPLEDFTAFTATSSANAQVNGAGTTFSDSTGGPADAQPAFGLNSIFPGAAPAPANNDMTPVGPDGNYSRGDAQVVSTSIIQPDQGGPVLLTGDLTQAWNVAESYIATEGFAGALAINGSETGFNTQITLNEPAILGFSFQADPYMAVEMETTSAGGTANANLDVTFTVSSGGTTVFEWSPNGQPGGIFNGVELQDEANLNGSIEVTSPGDSAIFDPTGDNSAGTISPATLRNFAATSGLLPPGVYSVSLDMVENVNVRTAEGSGLTIEKTPDADDEVSYAPGETASFTIKVTSEGPGPAVGVMINDDLPTAGALNLTWSIAGNPGPDACEIELATQHLTCAVGDLDAGEMFSVTVESVIPTAPPANPALALAGTDFNATDGNLLLDNSEIPAGAGAPPFDTRDWETFAAAIDCVTGDGCVFDTPSGNNDNSYTQGAKEDDRNPATSVGSIPPSKDDLLRWYFVQEFLNSDAFLYLAWVRSNQLATATIDFELNQSGELQPNGVNPTRTEGDVLIVYDFRGGRVDRLDLLRWLEDTNLHVDDDCEVNNGSVADGCWGNLVDLLGSGLAEGSVNFDDNGTNKPTDDGFPVADPIVNETLEKLRFGEAAINLTGALGDPTDCVVFAQAFVKSRASSSFTSELKDFIGPVPVNISNCVPVDNTAIGTGDNVPEVSDDGTFLLLP